MTDEERLERIIARTEAQYEMLDYMTIGVPEQDKADVRFVLALARLGLAICQLRYEPYEGGTVMSAWEKLENLVDDHERVNADDVSNSDGE